MCALVKSLVEIKSQTQGGQSQVLSLQDEQGTTTLHCLFHNLVCEEIPSAQS